MSQLRQHADQLTGLSVRVLVVTFERPDRAKLYAREFDLPWPLIIDDSRRLYRAYGMDRGRLWDIWGPANWGLYIKLLLRGRRLKKPTGDVNQLGGDVLIDPQGTVRLHHVGRGPADRPAVETLLDAVRANPRS